MYVRVLGSAAGGGLPQWNCGCAACSAARAGTLSPRTQDSLAVSDDGRRWVLLNATPDIRQQIAACRSLHPRALRHSPVAAVALTNADVDHCLGLFVLREGSPIAVHATATVLDSLRRHDALCRTLERTPEQVRWLGLEPEKPETLFAADGEPLGLEVEAVPLPGKLPPHLQGLVEPGPHHNVGLLVRSSGGGQTLGYAPGVAHDTPGVRRLLAEADLLFFDGTFWSDEELPALGAGARRAGEMAHWPLSGPGGSLELLRGAPCRVVLTHINNTNPILLDGVERQRVVSSGIDIADDGWETTL